MNKKIILITNNKELSSLIAGSRFVDGSSLDVLTAVRDAVHGGAKLLTHPLCGNLRPYQQPYRSVILEEIEAQIGTENLSVDLESLSLIENAVAVYRACEDRMLIPANLTQASREDYAFVDAELMRESLIQFRLYSNDRLLSPASMRTDGGVKIIRN